MVVHTCNPSVSDMQEDCVFRASLGYTVRATVKSGSHRFALLMASFCRPLHTVNASGKTVHIFLYLCFMFSYSV